jgi:hypothetical protein
MDPEPTLDAPTRRLLEDWVVPALPAWQPRWFFDESEIDVDCDGEMVSGTSRSLAVCLSCEEAACVKVIVIRQSGGCGLAIRTGVVVPTAYFFADSPPAFLADWNGVLRDAVPAVDRVFPLDADSIRGALVPALRDHVLPWFDVIRDEASLLALLDAGGEFEQVTAALMRMRRGEERGRSDLRLLLARSGASEAWKDCYRRGAARLGVDL